MSLITIKSACNTCKVASSVEVFSGDLKYYVSNRNALVQNVWPDLSADQREIIMSWDNKSPYFCPACWDNMFPEED